MSEAQEYVLGHSDRAARRLEVQDAHFADVAERLPARLRPGTRVGLLEPDFRSPLGRLAYLEATGRRELEPLRVWAIAINELYLAARISPAVGATLARTLELAGFRGVREHW